MPDGNGELLAAFDHLAKSVNQVQIGNSIARAQDKINIIRQDQTMNEFEKVKAQQALAQAMGTEVLARGGDAAHAEQARLGLAPQIPDAAMRQMEATGKATFAEAQTAIREKAIKEQRDLIKFQEDQKLRGIKLAKELTSGKGENKQLLDYGKEIDPTAARAGNLAKVDATYKASQRVDALFKQFPDYNIPRTQTSELATAGAALVNSGSAQSQEAIRNNTPESLRGDWNKTVGWLMNNPQGLEQQALMKSLHESALREKDVALQQINDSLDLKDSKHSNLFSSENPVIAERAKQMQARVRSIYPRPGGSAPAASGSAQSAAGYPVGNGAQAPNLGKYIKISP